MFQTLQQRWPPLFRVAEITTIEQANMRIGEFIEKFNQRFAVAPRNEQDAHVRLGEDDLQGLERIGAVWLERTISSSLTVSVARNTLQIYGGGAERTAIMKTRCRVIQYPSNNRFEIVWKSRTGEEKATPLQGHRTGKSYATHTVRGYGQDGRCNYQNRQCMGKKVPQRGGSSSAKKVVERTATRRGRSSGT